MIRIACPGCQRVYKVADDFARRQTKCRQCGMALLVPPSAAASPLPPDTPAAPGPSGRGLVEEFQRRKRRQIAIIPIGLVAIAALGVLAGPGDWPGRLLGRWEPTALAVPFLVIVGLAAVSAVNWRCPSCRMYLGPVLNIPTCRKCGAVLQSDQAPSAGQGASGNPSLQGVSGWLLVPAGTLIAVPMVLIWWWGRHVLLLASQLLPAIAACALGIPYFLRSRRVRETFVSSGPLPPATS